MSDKSQIEWTESTWSPVTGCTKVSAGCKHCYAEREVEMRWSKNPKSVWYGRAFADVRVHPYQYLQPLSWHKPRRIFVCPRSDLFHEDVPDGALDEIFATMMIAQKHTFQVLTKRPERAEQWFARGRLADNTPSRILALAEALVDWDRPPTWPLPNIWIGVSVEDQATAEERIPVLLDLPAAVRWISAEPLLGPINLQSIDLGDAWVNALTGHFSDDPPDWNSGPKLDWIVAGGESGPKARPMYPDWIRSLRDQCAAADVPFLFKQWGEWGPCEPIGEAIAVQIAPGMQRIGKRRAGRLLDGVLHDEYPR